MSLIAGAYQGAVRNTQTFLAVGHDSGLGRMRLEADKIVIDWAGAAQEPVFQRIEETFMRATAATGGTYMKNPLSLRLMGGNLLTVHPLGGCAMGNDRTTGVVNHKGQVFEGGPTAAPGGGPRRPLCVRWRRAAAFARGPSAAHHHGPGRAGDDPPCARPRLDHSGRRGRRAGEGPGS